MGHSYQVANLGNSDGYNMLLQCCAWQRRKYNCTSIHYDYRSRLIIPFMHMMQHIFSHVYMGYLLQCSFAIRILDFYEYGLNFYVVP